jgi:CcmD family protein
MKRLAALALFVFTLATPVFAQQPKAAQDEFLPVNGPVSPQDSIPAPRLVAIAYGFIWVMVFGYIWSIKSRLSTVEREIASVSKRVPARK